MNQSALTLITPVKEEKLELLKKVFREQGDKIKEGLSSLGSIHYARFVIFDKVTIDDETFPDQLCFSSNFDGDPDAHITDICNKLGPLVDLIYTNCADYRHHRTKLRT